MLERRVSHRLPICLPVQVLGNNHSNRPFQELGQTNNVSTSGLCFNLTTLVKEGELLQLSVNMPSEFRCFAISQTLNRCYGRVERVKCLPNMGFEVAVTIHSKNISTNTDNNQQNRAVTEIPFTTTPAACQLAIKPRLSVRPTSNIAAKVTSRLEKRRTIRTNMAAEAEFDFLNANDQLVIKEDGFIKDISKNGACIVTSYFSEPGKRVRIKLKAGNFSVNTVVKSITRLQTGSWQLHLEFIDNHWGDNHNTNLAADNNSVAQEQFRVGLEHYQGRRFSEAVNALLQAVKRAPEQAEYWQQLARTYCELTGQEKMAEWAYRQAMKANPQEANYAIDLGLLYERRGELSKAKTLYKRALLISPNNKDARLALWTL